MSKKRALDFGNGPPYAAAAAMPMDGERFIAEIVARPGIWQVNHRDHKNKMKTRKLWDEIQNQFPEFRVDDLKKRWKNLKDTYRKEIKRLPQHRPGVPDDNFTSGWRYYDSLHFLRQQFAFNRRDQDDSNQAEPDKYMEASSHSPASPASSKSDDEPLQASATSKRKEFFDVRTELLKIEKKKMKILEDEVAKNNEYLKSDNYHFLMSLLPEMDKLGPLQKMRLRAKISQAVLDEFSLGAYDNPNNYSEVPMREQLIFVEPDKVDVVKEEAINMYD